jgi:hypothetical protein
VANGAWFTADGVCGTWKGVCLAQAIVVPYTSAWGILPGLYLPSISVGGSTGIGILPGNVHSGPFFPQNSNQNACSVQSVGNGSQFTYTVTGRQSGGLCQITFSQQGSNPGPPQPVVAAVK